MSDSDAKYFGHLLEAIHDEVRAVHEVVANQPTHVEFEELRHDVTELKQDMKVVKAAVQDLSRQVRDHEYRISRVEAA